MDTVQAQSSALEEALAAGGLRCLFQPIVDLASGGTVGYEALTRGPGGPLELPEALFAAARADRRVGELDISARSVALHEAVRRGLRPPHTLFVNAEPEALDSPLPPDAEALLAREGDALRVVVEVTERALTDRPAELLRSVAAIRERGWGIALDDVGAERASLALMPFLRPDVVKLDLGLVQRRPDVEMAEIVHAVSAEAERTGAIVVAEGIETDEHLGSALAMGATLGQGWRFGRPAPLPRALPVALHGVPIAGRWRTLPGASPFELLSGARPVRRGTKGLLLTIARQLEAQAATLGESSVVLTAFQDARYVTSRTRDRYARLSDGAAFVGAMGGDLVPGLLPGVRGTSLAEGDPLRDEWALVVVGAHFAGAFAARDLGDDGDDRARRFDFALTFDRDLAVEVARSLMGRLSGVARAPL